MQLTREDRKEIARRSTEDSEAYRLYLKARFHWRKRSSDDLRLSLDYFTQAIAQDPLNAQAHAGLSEAHCLLVWYGLLPPAEGLAAAELAAREAVRLDPDLAEAHAALGFARAMRGDFGSAEHHLTRALERNPGYYLAHDWYALVLCAQARNDEAMNAMHRARQIDPLSPVIHHHSAWVYFLSRRFDDAIRVSRSALAVDPEYPFGHFWLGIASTEVGDHTTAVASLERAVERFARAPVAVAALGHAYGRAERTAEARAMLDALAAAREHHVDPYHFALVGAALDPERAVGDLHRAAAGPTLWHTFYARCDPRIDAIRGLAPRKGA